MRVGDFGGQTRARVATLVNSHSRMIEALVFTEIRYSTITYLPILIAITILPQAAVKSTTIIQTTIFVETYFLF
jgi:hypothetical protein